jgi:DNA-binding transcriptional LysR family regulator
MTIRANDWAQLLYFLAVARSGSLRSAAEEMGATHATVDRNLKALEQAYGVRLFDRSRAGLKLTPAGDALIPMAQAAEESVISARRQIEGLDREASGTVRLSVAPSLAFDVLPPILASFSEAYPDIELKVAVTNKFENLTRSEADVSIRMAFEVSDDVVGRRVLQYALALYASQDYLDRHWDSQGPKGEGLHWIGWGSSTRPIPDWVRDSPYPRAKLVHAIGEGVLVARMVEQGIGMSYLPCYSEKSCPRLVRVPGHAAELNRSIWLLLHSDLRRTTRVRLLVDHISDALRSQRKLFLNELA